MKITTTDKLPDLNVAGLDRILQVKPVPHEETLDAQHEARADEHITYPKVEQSAELKDYPKYEEVKVDGEGTFMHPALKSKKNLIDWVLSMLGYPLVGVELRSNHFDTAIGNALMMYTKYATFPRKYILRTSRDYVPGVGIDLSRENVCQVYDVQYGLSFSGWGTVLPWMINRTSSGWHGSGNLAGTFITYHNFVEFKKMAQRLMQLQPDWDFNQTSRKLTLIPEPTSHIQDGPPPYHSELFPHEKLTSDSFRQGIPMVLEVECEPPVHELYNNEHVRRMTLAYCKIMLGQIRGKYEGINLPGGGNVSKEIGAEGKEELDKILETMKSEISMGQEVFFA